MLPTPNTFRAFVLLACCRLLSACSAILRNPVPPAYIEAQTADLGEEQFDPAYMYALFKCGYQRVVAGKVCTAVDLCTLSLQAQ